MKFILQKIWSIWLPVPMPWQMIFIGCLGMFIIPWVMFRFFPWIIIKFLQLSLILIKGFSAFMWFVECKITESKRNKKQEPIEILCKLSDLLASIISFNRYLSIKTRYILRYIFRLPWRIPRKIWYIYITPVIIILPFWFLRPYLGSSNVAKFIDSTITWSCSLEHWIMVGEWKPSRLTCHYPTASPKWKSFLKAKEYQLKHKIRDYTKEIAINPNNVKAYYDRGNAYLELQNTDAAFKDYTHTVRIDRTYAPGYVGRGDIYFLKKDNFGAFREYSKAVKFDQKYAPAYVGLGHYYLAIKDSSSAFKEYSIAVNLNSEYAPGYVGKGDVYQQKGDKEAALKEYQKAISIDPNYARSYERIGHLYYHNFYDQETALENYKKAGNLYQKSGQIILHNAMINIIDQLNNYTIYTVRRGDSLSKIAQIHGVSLNAIVSANSKKYPTLRTNRNNIEMGWKLRIPQ